ncbi:MAG: hypothetical protein ACTHNW_06630 [Mucilaginibacter sp.]
MNDIIYSTIDFRDKRVSIKQAVTILAKNNITVDEDEARLILNFMYQIAKSYYKYDVIKSKIDPN